MYRRPSRLEGILRDYLFGGKAPIVAGLLFPSPRTGELIVDFDKTLDSLALLAGWQPGEIRSKMFRHTYCSARLQTARKIVAARSRKGRERHEWIPTPPFTVSKELGHGGTRLVERVYGHIAQAPHYTEQPEYLVDSHAGVEGFADRLRALRAAARQ